MEKWALALRNLVSDYRPKRVLQRTELCGVTRKQWEAREFGQKTVKKPAMGQEGTARPHWLRTSKLLKWVRVGNGPVESWAQRWHGQEGQYHQNQSQASHRDTARKW